MAGGFPETVNPPGAASYSAPLLNFAQFGQWANDFQQGALNSQQRTTNDQTQQINQQKIQQGQRQQEIDTLFAGGLPKDAQGNIDYQKVAAMLAQKGDISALTQLTPLIQQAQAASTPEFPGPQGGAPQGGATQPSSVQSRPLPAPAANSPKGDPGQGTLVDVVTDKLPSQNLTTGETITKIAQVMGVDPNATLTPGQMVRAQGLLKKYAPDIAGSGGGGSPLPPSANAGSPAPQITPQQPRAQPAAQPGAPQPQAQPQPQAVAAQPQQPQPPGAAQPQPAPQQAPQGGPITPQVPLPPGYTDPQEAILALNRRAAQLEAANPKMKPKADDLRAWAGRIEESIKPVDVTSMTTRLDGRSGKLLYQGPGAAALANAGKGGQSLEADAQRYRQTGTLPPNMGRGAQGEAEAKAIRARAVQQEIEEGGDPSAWPEKWQAFKAKGVGLNTAERTKAGREENLSIILRAAEAAVPAALEASKALPRGDYVPLTKLIQKGEVMSSNPKLIQFGMANLQLAEHWARAMNPTGVMREGDRDKALSFLDTAYGNNAYEAAVTQLQKQIARERDAVRGGTTITKDNKAPDPNSEGKTQEWVRRADGTLGPAE